MASLISEIRAHKRLQGEKYFLNYRGAYAKKPDAVCIVMEFCPSSLRELLEGKINLTRSLTSHLVIERGSGISEECIRFICRELLQAINILHDRQMIHRDIVTSNILINTQGEIKLW